MEESLKALRLTHRALLLLLAAILLFALSPSKHRTYERAYSFLESLETIDEDAHKSWAEKISNQHLVSRHELLKNIFDEVARRGGPTIEWQHMANGTVGPGPNIKGSSIESINRTFREDLPVQALNLSTERIASLVLNDVDSSKNYRLDNFNVSGTVGIGRMDLQLYLYDEEGNLEHVRGTAKFDRRPISDQSFSVWLDENGHASLVSTPDESGIVFEPLRPVWPFIYSKSVAEAKDWLQQELLRLGDAKVLTVLGISISELQASIAAPAVTLVFLLALSAQLRHTTQLLPSNSNAPELFQTFPWIPLFPGKTGLTARVFTILLLPISANAWLLLRVRSTATWVGWLEWVFLIGAAVWAYTEASSLASSRLAASSPAAEADANTTSLVATKETVPLGKDAQASSTQQ